MKKVTAPTFHRCMPLTSFGTMNLWNHSAQKRYSQIRAGCILLVGMNKCTHKDFASLTLYLLIAQMKNFDNDTTAAIATAISGSSAVLHFANTWQPLFALVLALVGIVSGLFAIRYYAKKIDKLDDR
jgi:uncharacterized membrane protein